MEKRVSKRGKASRVNKKTVIIAIIAIASILGVALVGFLVYWFFFRNNCNQDNCPLDIFCSLESEKGVEFVVPTVTFAANLVERVGITQDSYDSYGGGVSGFTKQKNINPSELANWAGEWVKKYPKVLKTETGKEVKCGEISAELQYLLPTALGLNIEVPEGHVFLQVFFKHASPGSLTNDTVTFTDEGKSFTCDSVDCANSKKSVPKQWFSSGKCPVCKLRDS